MNKIIACVLAWTLVGAVQATEDFRACPQFFANAQPPLVAKLIEVILHADRQHQLLAREERG